MKSGPNTLGFTIVEVMIFLAVSGALLVVGLSAVSGSQGKSEFNVAVNDTQQQIDTVINNVANGYYANTSSVKCENTSDTTDISYPATPPDTGTNLDCAYIGRVIWFRSTNPSALVVYSVAGIRENGAVPTNKKEVTSMIEADPEVIVNSKEEIELKNGLTIGKVTIGTSGPQVGAVGFFTSFGSNATNGGLNSASSQYNFAGIQGTTTNSDNIPFTVSQSLFRTNYEGTGTYKKNPFDGISVCLVGTDNKFAIITIGGSGKSATTTKTIAGVSCL